MNPLLEDTQFIRFLDVTEANVIEFREVTLKEVDEFISKISSNLTMEPETFISELSNITAILLERANILTVFNLQIRIPPLLYVSNETNTTFNNKKDNLFRSELIVNRLKNIQVSPEFADFDDKQKRIYFRLLSFCPKNSSNIATKNSIQQHKITHYNNIMVFTNQYVNVVKKLPLFINENTNLTGLSDATIENMKAQAYEHNFKGYVAVNDELLQILSFANDSSTRKQAYDFLIGTVKQLSNKSINLSVIVKKIIETRNQIARLEGCNSHVDMKSAEFKLNTSDKIEKFLMNLLIPAQNSLNKVIDEIKNFANSSGYQQPLQPWDYYYYRNKLVEHNCPLMEGHNCYFELDNVLKGISTLVERYYGVTIKDIQNESVWHQDVKRFVVMNKDGKKLGYIEFDAYSRPTKFYGTYVNSYKRRWLKQNNIENLPVAIINMNYNKSNNNDTVFFRITSLVTLLHEFGHALHHIMIQENNPILSSFSEIQLDWQEFPSKFLEQFAYDAVFLKLVGRHFYTKEIITDEMIKQIQKSRIYFQFNIVNSIVNSLFDNYIYQRSLNGNFDKWISTFKQDLGINYEMTELTLHSNLSSLIHSHYYGSYFVYEYAQINAVDAFNRIQHDPDSDPEQKCKEMLEKVLAPGNGCGFTEACYQKFINGEVATKPISEEFEMVKNPPTEPLPQQSAPQIVNTVSERSYPYFQNFRLFQQVRGWNSQHYTVHPIQGTPEPTRVPRITK